MPRPLRGIFRKRRKLLDHLFRVSLGTLRDWMRARLSLPSGELAAIASVQTFGDYLNFHPHLHVLAASGLVDREGRFHLLPVEPIEPSPKNAEGFHGLWEGIIALPPPPRPPFDIEKRRGIGGVLDAGEAGARRVSPPGRAGESNMEPLDVPEHWGWSDTMDPPPADWWAGAEPAWEAPELDLGDDRVLVLDAGDPFPPDEWPGFPDDSKGIPIHPIRSPARFRSGNRSGTRLRARQPGIPRIP